MPQLFCFDLNGVLINDEHLHFISFRTAIKENTASNLDLSQSLYDTYFAGKTDCEGFKSFFAAHQLFMDDNSLKTLQREKTNSYSKALSNNKLKNDLVIDTPCRLVRKLRENGFLTALVTGSKREEVEQVFSLLPIKLDDFNLVLTRENYKKSKPHPEPYLVACQKLVIEPAQTLVIEDSPSGIMAAQSAGCTCIALTTTHAKKHLKNANFIIEEHLLADLIEKILEGGL